MIKIHQLYKKYSQSDFFALNDFSIEISEGEIYGLLGPNGSGKTTLISILCGLIQPTAGEFSLLGLNYKNDTKALKK